MTWRALVHFVVNDVERTADEPYLQCLEQVWFEVDEQWCVLAPLYHGSVQRHGELPRRRARCEGFNLMRLRLGLRQRAGSQGQAN